jgi:hypothetical protein
MPWSDGMGNVGGDGGWSGSGLNAGNVLGGGGYKSWGVKQPALDMYLAGMDPQTSVFEADYGTDTYDLDYGTYPGQVAGGPDDPTTVADFIGSSINSDKSTDRMWAAFFNPEAGTKEGQLYSNIAGLMLNMRGAPDLFTTGVQAMLRAGSVRSEILDEVRQSMVSMGFSDRAADELVTKWNSRALGAVANSGNLNTGQNTDPSRVQDSTKKRPGDAVNPANLFDYESFFQNLATKSGMNAQMSTDPTYNASDPTALAEEQKQREIEAAKKRVGYWEMRKTSGLMSQAVELFQQNLGGF